MAEEFTQFEPQVFFGDSTTAAHRAPSASPLFVTGTSVLTAKLVVVAMHAVACGLVWRIGRRVFDDRVGLVAAATTWITSPAIIWLSTKTRGFYGSGIVVAMAIVLFVVRLTSRDPDCDEDRRDLLAVGFAAGVAWWTGPITLLWPGLRWRPVWRSAVISGPGFGSRSGRSCLALCRGGSSTSPGASHRLTSRHRGRIDLR